jgi:integrase/recombinase XerD
VSALEVGERQVAWAARIMREAVKDKSYELTETGQVASRFLRSLRWQGCKPNTLNTYETVLSKFSLHHADYELERFCAPDGSELLRSFLDGEWGDAKATTRRNRLSILKSFFDWSVGEGLIAFSPAAAIKGPKPHRPLRNAHELAEIQSIVAAQSKLQDEVAILLMGRLAFRKDDVRRFQVRDVDLAHDLVLIRRGKGEKPATVPIAYDEVRQALALWLTEDRDPQEYLLYPKSDKLRMLDPSSLHRWWNRRLKRAGLASFPMHELRHSALQRLWEKTGNMMLVRDLARHTSIATTEAYLHPKSDDLRAAMIASDRE